MSAPASTPPEGGDQNNGPSIIIVNWSLTVLALITVIARMWGRFKITRNAGRDDLCIVIAMFFSTLYTAMCTAAAMAGNGRHPYYLSNEQLSYAIKINSIALIPGVMAFSTPKLAVAFLLIRLLNPSKVHRWIMYFLSVSCIVLAGLCAVFLFVQCTPVRGLWTPTLQPKCWEPSVLVNFTIFTGSYSAFVDLYFAAFPVTILLQLQIKRRKKIGLSFVMSLGFVATIVAIYKCTRLPELGNHEDYTYATADLLIWTSVESNVIIIAACLPTLRPVFLWFMNQVETMSGRSNNSSNHIDNYYLSSLPKHSSKPIKEDGGPFQNRDSVDLILPTSGIQRTLDVTVNWEPRKGKQ